MSCSSCDGGGHLRRNAFQICIICTLSLILQYADMTALVCIKKKSSPTPPVKIPEVEAMMPARDPVRLQLRHRGPNRKKQPAGPGKPRERQHSTRYGVVGVRWVGRGHRGPARTTSFASCRSSASVTTESFLCTSLYTCGGGGFHLPPHR